MDADSSVSAYLVLVALCALCSRRLPTRVVRHGPGRRRAGRFVQLWKNINFLPVVEVRRTGTGKNNVLPD
jgi:hypothetical protein